MTMLGGSCSVHVVFPMMPLQLGQFLVSVDNVDLPLVVTTSGDGLAKVLLDAFVPFLVMPAFVTCDPNWSTYTDMIAAGNMTTEQARNAAASARKTMRSSEPWKFATDLANAVGSAVVGYIQTNAVVDLAAVVATVSSQQVGRTPSPNDPNTAIQAPFSPVTLPVTNGGSTTIGVA